MNTAPKRIQIDELPEGWIEINLSTAVESMKNGLYKPAQEYAERGVACLRMYNIDGGRIIWKNIKRMLLSSDEVNEYHLAPGDLLVNRVNSRELVGKTAVFPKELEPCVFESKNIRVRLLRDLVNSDFVNYQLFLSGQHYFNYNSQQVVGMASISQPQIGNFPLLLPPRIEQERIVSAVRAMLATVEKSSSRVADVAKTLKRFRQAVLAAACSGRLTADWREKNLLPTDAASIDPVDLTATLDQFPEDIELPQEWRLSTLDKLLIRVEAGKNIRCLEYPPGVGQKGIVKISAVSWGEFLEEESKTLEDPSLFMPERAIRAGDLLISRANTIDLVGACVLVRDVKRTLMLSDKVLRLEATDKWKRWLQICLRSPIGRFQIENLATGNQLSMRNITQDSLRRIVIPLPSPRERDEAVHRAEQLLGLADAIEERIVGATSRCNNLAQSILAKAFRGELVPTEAELARREGREYEPASVLLERISKRRDSDIVSKSNGKTKRPKMKRDRAKV